MAIAIFGGGCFWCIDAAFRKVKGVSEVISGYCGGEMSAPTYQQICTGLTGHAEVVKIEFDEHIVSYSNLLEFFFALHDPTQLNRQGNDVGTQYRSVIFYQDDVQKLAAQKYIAELQHHFEQPIVTELAPNAAFYSAEHYHQDYYQANPTQPYCSMLIAPKLQKFYQRYCDYLTQ